MLDLLNTGQTTLAKKLSNTKRYIDDILCFGTPPPPQAIYKMEYRQTNSRTGDATFLGIRIRNENNPVTKRSYIRLSVLDKAEDYPYRPLTYTTVFSTAPANFGSSILIGGLVRASRIANNLPDLKREMNNIMLKLVRRNYPLAPLKRAFRKWLLDTYPEPKFGEFVNSLIRHFQYLCAEIMRIQEIEDNAHRERCTSNLLKERPFIKYRGLILDNTRNGSNASAPPSSSPATPAPSAHSSVLPPLSSSSEDAHSSSSTGDSQTSSTSEDSHSTSVQPTDDTFRLLQLGDVPQLSDSSSDSESESTDSSNSEDSLKCPGCGTTTTKDGVPFASVNALNGHKGSCAAINGIKPTETELRRPFIQANKAPLPHYLDQW